jgi:4-coumarate--CoA ligase
MTEATCSILGSDPNIEADPGSVGELNANCSAMIMSPEGKEVPTGERGEIWVQAPKYVLHSSNTIPIHEVIQYGN